MFQFSTERKKNYIKGGVYPVLKICENKCFYIDIYNVMQLSILSATGHWVRDSTFSLGAFFNQLSEIVTILDKSLRFHLRQIKTCLPSQPDYDEVKRRNWKEMRDTPRI